MATSFLKRLSGSLWPFSSPEKKDVAPHRAPVSAPPKFKKPSVPASRRHSLKHAVANGRSMSPASRVQSWQDQDDTFSSPTNRKRPLTTVTSSGRRNKVRRLDSASVDSRAAYSVDVGLPRSYSSPRTPSSPFHYSEASAVYQDDSEVVTDREWEEELARRNRKLEAPDEDPALNFVDEDLRAEGWDDDFIELKQRILLRGREAILPGSYKLDFRSLPDGLFCNDQDAILRSLQGQRMVGVKALQRLMEMGGYVRDGLKEELDCTPELQAKRFTRAYMKWADRDSGLDLNTSIPVLELLACSSASSGVDIENIARRKLARLQDRYMEAFRVQPSIELSPSSNSTKLAYPIPQLFALAFSGPIAALMAWRPDLEKDLHVVAMFDFTRVAFDGWTALTFAILICHCRDMQVRIAEETGLGTPTPKQEEEEDDPDF